VFRLPSSHEGKKYENTKKGQRGPKIMMNMVMKSRMKNKEKGKERTKEEEKEDS